MRHWTTIVATLLFVLAGLLTTPVAQAQYFGQNKVQYEKFKWKTLETEHFIFHFYPEEERAVRDAARMAERWYSRHTQLFLHRFDEKKPIIFYANDADFQQTNVVQQSIGQGTGGLTEPLKERVVMPFAASYAETNHVLGHELVHSFQFDLALNSNANVRLQQLPLWITEGMAEYLTQGREDTHTAMWMRDAVRRDGMPSFRELQNPREYFPYRYGHAHLAYLAGKYGDQAVPNLFKRAGQVGVDSAYVQLFGISADSLNTEWVKATRDAYLPLLEGRTSPEEAGRKVLASDIDGGNINIAPSISPDGRWVAFISERDLFNFNLFVADAETGEVIADLDRSGTTSHFNALRFLNSAGSWSPDGRRLAFVSFADGDNQITIWDVMDEDIERSFQVDGVSAMKNPAWSPDGSRIAFTGTDGGISDLYVLNLETREVRQLTNDRYADLQPTWSPDGETLAFTTDRAKSDLSVLDMSGNMDIGFVDLESGDITVRAPFGDALHHNPQFSPDGRSLYFISDQDGFKDIYRMELESGDLARVTNLQTGVSGITAMSPAMSVASQAGDMMFSVYAGGDYTGLRLSADQIDTTPLADGTTAYGARVPDPPTPDTDTTEADTTQTTVAAADTTEAPADTMRARAGVLPPHGASDQGMVASSLRDSRTGLPPASEDYASEDYDASLQLDGIFSPGVGVQVGGRFGSGVAGGVGLRFSDMLGNQVLTTVVSAQGTHRDIAAAASYLNQRGQLNWGGSVSHIPVIFESNTIPTGGGTAVSINRRAFISSASADASYPLDQNRRFEFSLTGTRYGFGVNVREFGFNDDVDLGDIRDAFDIPDDTDGPLRDAEDAEFIGSVSSAYVRDFTTMGFTGPIRGGRWRLEVEPTTGTQDFVKLEADLRRYFHAQPFTFAFQGLHVGNYGAEFNDGLSRNRLGVGQEFIGFPLSRGFVRGYNVRNISEGIAENQRRIRPDQDPEEAARQAGCTPIGRDDALVSQCAELDRLFGTRSLVTRAEVRVPLLGPKPLGLIPFQFVPTTLAAFTDAGVTWTGDDGPNFEFTTDASEDTTIPVVSSGLALRFNILGQIPLEMYYARPFQRQDTTWQLGFRIAPGF